MISARAMALAAVLLGLSTGFFPFKSSDDPHFPSEALPTASGYLQLNRSSARLFYAFYEAQDPTRSTQETPLILWLQGGPGCSSMTGNFYELGPWRIRADLELERNPYSWNRRFGVLFIDNPAGSGYSVAERDEDVPTDQEKVAEDLYSALRVFFDSQPGYFRNRPLFIAGESYAGKYVPALGHYLQRLINQASSGSDHLRLDGLIIGNGLTDPVAQVVTHAQTAHSLGLIDIEQKSHAETLAQSVVKLIEDEDWQGAYVARTGYMNWIENVTGLATVLDVRRDVPYHCTSNGTEFLRLFLNRANVKAALKAEEKAEWVSCNARVRKIMSSDTMKSVKWMVEEVLRDFPVLLFQGQFDIKDGVVSSESWIRTMEWEGRDEFDASPRLVWRVGGRLAGYWRSVKKLTHVVVLGAGHMVPADQGLRSQEMIEQWVEEQVLGRSTLHR